MRRRAARDGGIVTIRPAWPTDRPALTRLFGDATPASLRFRFFARPSSRALDTDLDAGRRWRSLRAAPLLTGYRGGVVAVDAKLRLAPVGAEPDPMLRRLSAAELPGKEPPCQPTRSS